jgi:hypothetical protein
MACLRNLVIGLLGRAGAVNLAAELRRHARNPRRPLATLGISLGWTRHHDSTTKPWPTARTPLLVLLRCQRVRPGRDELLRAYLAACVASGYEPSRELRVQLGTGPQSMERGLKSENGRMACIPCPLVRMTISADWSPRS